MGTPAIESAGEHCHKLDDVSSQLHLKTLLGRGLQDNNFDPKVMAKLKNQISAEAQESILVIDYEVTQLPLKNANKLEKNAFNVAFQKKIAKTKHLLFFI